MVRDHTLYFSKIGEKQLVKNAKDTSLQRYAIIQLLWLKNATQLRSLFLGRKKKYADNYC